MFSDPEGHLAVGRPSMNGTVWLHLKSSTNEAEIGWALGAASVA